jgi:hypothetical protein
VQRAFLNVAPAKGSGIMPDAPVASHDELMSL